MNEWGRDGEGGENDGTRANEKVGQESGIEKVNNGRTDEIAMEDWPRNEECGGSLIYTEIKTLSLIK